MTVFRENIGIYSKKKNRVSHTIAERNHTLKRIYPIKKQTIQSLVQGSLVNPQPDRSLLFVPL